MPQVALTRVLPFGWDELDASSPGVARLLGEARGFGLAHGFSAPVHGRHGEDSVFSLARRAPLPQETDRRLSLFQRALWFAGVMHRRLRDLAPGAAAPARPLTGRERDCLELAARGYSAHAIGRSMNIAERTVVFHLNHAEEKLGARRRQEAIARAVACGQIGPASQTVRFDGPQVLVEPQACRS